MTAEGKLYEQYLSGITPLTELVQIHEQPPEKDIYKLWQVLRDYGINMGSKALAVAHYSLDNRFQVKFKELPSRLKDAMGFSTDPKDNHPNDIVSFQTKHIKHIQDKE